MRPDTNLLTGARPDLAYACERPSFVGFVRDTVAVVVFAVALFGDRDARRALAPLTVGTLLLSDAAIALAGPQQALVDVLVAVVVRAVALLGPRYDRALADKGPAEAHECASPAGSGLLTTRAGIVHSVVHHAVAVVVAPVAFLIARSDITLAHELAIGACTKPSAALAHVRTAGGAHELQLILLVGIAVAVVVHAIADLVGGPHLSPTDHVTVLAGGDALLASACRSAAGCIEPFEVLVDLAVAVVVAAVAFLELVRLLVGRAGVLATIGGVLVDVVVTLDAVSEEANTGLTTGDAVEVAATRWAVRADAVRGASAAVVGIVRRVVVFVEDAIAIVVDPVTTIQALAAVSSAGAVDGDRGCLATSMLAAVPRIAVEVVEADVAALDYALAVDACVEGVVEKAREVAPSAMAGIAGQLEILVDLAIAIVVVVVADLVRFGVASLEVSIGVRVAIPVGVTVHVAISVGVAITPVDETSIVLDTAQTERIDLAAPEEPAQQEEEQSRSVHRAPPLRRNHRETKRRGAKRNSHSLDPRVFP